MRKCPECGGSVVGRCDRKFCCDDCRNSYHNRRNRTENNELKRINRILKNNYCIIREISSPSVSDSTSQPGDKNCYICSRDYLLSQGFNFYYHTSLDEINPGELRFHCYDIAYRIEENGTTYIYRPNNYQ
ncbi:MAG: hypothetical protein PHP30_04365 [Bacteroidales bacterium]|nr:hypothetical protein [Bacteroidales bacterium]MDD3989314.1 hypothetical protein [Bacteroidales bacterium]MDD4639225.1 hypothetical protein [Bacteroidales bacterium]